MLVHPVLHLKEIVEEAGYSLRSYSGRGMYGKQCVGVTVPNVRSLWEIAAMLGEEDAMELGSPDSDNMGPDIIVYWPTVGWEPEYATDDDI